MPKRESLSIHVDLIPGESGTAWGWCFSMEGAGGCGPGGLDQHTALLKVYQAIRKELKRIIETREEKAARLDKAKRVASLRNSKNKGTLP